MEVPNEYVFGKQDGAVCKRDVVVPEEEVVVNQISLVVSETWECLKNTCLEYKMARDVYEKW